MEDKNNAIIERLRSRREELGLSYYGLAERTGLSKSTLQRYETGKIKNIPLAQLQTLAMGLRTSPEWLLGFMEDPDASGMYLFASQLTPFDKRLLNNFHQADDGTKKAVCKLLDVQIASTEFEKPEPYAQLNLEGYE